MAIIGKMLLFCKASGQAADSSGLCRSICGEAVLRHPPIPQMFPRLRRPICDEEFLRIEAASYGRIARAIADLALSRSENSPQRFYSMSSRISAERGQYYDVLERTQKGDLDITEWLRWFLARLDEAFDQAEETLSSVAGKARFWDAVENTPLNERQRLVLNRLLDGFEGKLTSSKWAKLAKCSQDTASRDIDDLIRKNILTRGLAGGRSTSYELVLNEDT